MERNGMNGTGNNSTTAVPRWKARLIANYLPQFHPTPENDAWWGRGFTEWTNVIRSKPLFRGHRQPRLPTELGFYDLRVPDTRWAQAELARAHGIEAFCYWHYWFEGKRLLERPFAEVLASGEPDFPFCLAWANESWSRRWLGEERDVLMKQGYSAQDDRNHARWCMPAFADPRCLRYQGRPVFAIYRPFDLPEPERTMVTFRDEAHRHGLPNPYLIGCDAHQLTYEGICEFGFDHTWNFEPALGCMPYICNEKNQPDDRRRWGRLLHNLRLGVASGWIKIYDYPTGRNLMWESYKPFPTIPTVMAGWDNSPRRGKNGIVFLNDTPANFKAELVRTIASVLDKPFEERLIFLNAWNEWAEGNYLEPDELYGRGKLEAVRDANRADAAATPAGHNLSSPALASEP